MPFLIEKKFAVCYNIFTMENAVKIWDKVKKELSNKLSATAFLVWINSIEALTIKDGELVLCAPSKNSRDTVEKNYLEDIKYCINILGYNFTSVLIITEDEKQYFVTEDDAATTLSSMIDVKKEKPLSQFVSKYTFDNFVVGESNKLAFVSAKTVAENPGVNDNLLTLNPLYIYGGVGLGKTHLLHSIGNYLNEHNPSIKVLYVPTETLTNEYFASLSKYSSDKDAYRNFREKYTSVDVLMIDDIQFLQRKGGLQDIIFHIFNALYINGKQIVLSSDRAPREINDIEDRLRTRFEGGLMTDIDTPNIETRIAIIIKKLEKENIALSDDIIYFLAEKINSNIRELEGALLKVIMYSQLINKVPTLELAKEALKVDNIDNGNNIDSNKIIEAVCQYFRISHSEIVGKKRTKDIVEARMIAIYLIREFLDLPLVTIGQIFGGRDHSTIIYSHEKISSSINTLKTSTQIKDIRSMLNI
ncbi:MAG: chromosomal replication initiator protein DnaA [Clostridiales bacterium]|nr:chromosomal replication initiator protein DnaA [Clostridiales bacterium]